MKCEKQYIKWYDNVNAWVGKDNMGWIIMDKE